MDIEWRDSSVVVAAQTFITRLIKSRRRSCCRTWDDGCMCRSSRMWNVEASDGAEIYV